MDIFKLIGSIFIKNDDANTQIDNTASKAKDMSTTIGSAMEKAGSKITGIGKAIAPVSVAVGAMLATSTKSASDFTDGMAKMSTLFDTSKTSVQNLSKEFLDLSNKTGISATELAEAGYQALSAGQNVDQVGKFVETAGNLAKAGFTSTTTAVDVLTTAMNAYGEGAGSAEQIANKLVRTQNLGKTTVDELASSMGKIIPTASSMGVNINNLTSGYVSLTKQGITTAESTTYMNSMLNELGDSGTTLGGVLKDKTGKSFQDLMSEGYSLADVLQITKDYADENGIAYNELWGSAEAGKAGLAILNGGVEEFNDTVETMASDVDDVGEALDKLDTPSKKIQKSLNRVKNSGIELGTTILTSMTPAIDKASGVVEKATNWFNGLSDGTKQIIATVGGVIAVASPVLMIGGKVITFIGGVIPKITQLQSSLGGLSGVIGMLTSPVGIVVMAIGALIAVFVALYNHNEQFRNKVNLAWELIKIKIQTVIQAVQGFVQAGMTFIQGAIQTAVGIIQAVWSNFGTQIVSIISIAFDFVSEVIQTALDLIAGIINTVTAIIQGDWSGAWESIKNTAQTVWDGIKSIVDSGIKLTKSVIQTGLNAIKTLWTNVWNAIKTVATNIWNGIKSVIQNAINAVKTTVSNILNAIKTTFSNIWNAIKTVIQDVWDSIKNVISSGINTVKTTISNILNAIKTTFDNIWNAIKTTVLNVVNAIKTTISNVWNAIKTTISNTLNGIKTTVSNAFNTVKTTVSNAIDNVKNKISSGLNSAKTTVSNIFNSIRDKIKNIMDSAKNAVSNAIDKIKAKFKFKWSLPHLKLPSISISGKFSINPPSAPHFSLSWHKDQMTNPMLMTKPTIFGYNPKTGVAHAGGEAGNEILYGHQNLLDDIRTASGYDAIMNVLENWLSKIFGVLSDYLPAISETNVVLDSDTLVGKITPKIDKQLGKIYTSKSRGY